MTEKASTIGLSWAPKISIISDKSKARSAKPEPQDKLLMQENKLVDGLYVPPSDPRMLNKLKRMSRKDTAGTSWFDMPAPTITPELKKDLQIIKLRNVIDPKVHYKKAVTKSKVLPKYFQMGTVIESSTDFFSSRLTKKERKSTIADELLSDRAAMAYRKRKIREINDANRPSGNAKWKNRGNEKRKKPRKAIL